MNTPLDNPKNDSGKNVVNIPQENPAPLTEWARAIHQVWSRGAGNTLELARIVSQARGSLPYGGWGRLWQSETLPFSKRKGEMLVAIGQEMGSLDAQNSAQLPPAWNTLYFLARLGRAAVERLIEQGRIHPYLSLREARALLPGHHSKSQGKNSCSRLKARLARLAVLIRAESESWPEEERRFVRNQLLALANELVDKDTTNGTGLCDIPTSPFHSHPFDVKRSLVSGGATLFPQTTGTRQASFSTL